MTVREDEAAMGARVLDGLKEPTRDLLLETLLYKSVFTGHSFRSLAAREPSEDVRETLLKISRESIAEGVAATLLMREWDQHVGSWDGIIKCAHETRARLLQDLVALKEGMVESGLAMAMAAPNASLRDRFLKIVDLDRQHADRLRELRHTAVTDVLARAIEEVSPLGADARRDALTSLGGTIRRRVEALEQKGVRLVRLVVSPEGARHLRDEGHIGRDGRAFGLWLEVDMAWHGEAFALESEDRLSFSELLAAAAAEGASEERKAPE